MERIPASERTREKLKAVIAGSSDGGTSELVRLAARVIIEEALRAKRATRWGSCGKPHLSHRGALRRLRRLRGVELAVALFDAASPLEAGNGCADVIRASSLACSGDFPLRLALCQSKHLITEGG